MVHELYRREILSTSPEQTAAIGVWLGQVLPPRTCVALDGDLGAGKTTLTRGIGAGLGSYPVSSPSFTLHDLHEGGRLPLSHCDAWMEGRELSFLEDGGSEWLVSDGVAVVEWAERVKKWLPSPRMSIRIGHQSESQRSLEFTVLGSQEPLDGLAKELVDLLAKLPEGGALLPEGFQ